MDKLKELTSEFPDFIDENVEKHVRLKYKDTGEERSKFQYIIHSVVCRKEEVPYNSCIFSFFSFFFFLLIVVVFFAFFDIAFLPSFFSFFFLLSIYPSNYNF